MAAPAKIEVVRTLDSGAKAPTPPLENGEQLTASEFLRRYEAMPELNKAELIEGIVYMPSPVRLEHAEPDTLMHGWLMVYAAHTPGTVAASNATVRLDAENVPQPDALLRLLPECGGKARVEAGYVVGPPELIVEIAASTGSIDLRDKLRAYRRAGVREYLVWRTQDEQFDWFVLEQDEYRRQQPDQNHCLQSAVFPGLVLESRALLARDAAKVLAVLEEHLRQPEHTAFAARLEALSKGRG